MREAVIVEAVRTGRLSGVRPDDLAAEVLMRIGFGQGIATIIERL
jgi:hypothetical protein